MIIMEQEQKKEIISDLTKRMEGAIASLKHSLSGLRAGRASVNILDPIKVELYGNDMPVSQLGTISTPDARTLSIQVWDKSAVKEVEKAILNSGLGFNPIVDGQLIRILIPNLSEDRRKELVKKANEYSEQSKISIRNVRRDGIDTFKKLEKAKDISEDELRDITEEIQKLTDKYVKNIDDTISQKSQEIINI